jgi:hypothetical protein
MFRPLGGHVQAIKVHKIKITVTRLYFMGRFRSQSFAVRVYMSI